MKKGISAVIGLCFILFLVGCSSDEQNEVKANDIKKMVQEYSASKTEDVSASITSHELIVKDEQDKEITYDLSKEDFFVSIAPFVKDTHPCEIHSLTGCQGELANKEFDVMIKDKDGKVIIDKKIKSLENGFIDVWLPRDQTFQVKIQYGERISESTISTFKGDHTCITTMQLI